MPPPALRRPNGFVLLATMFGSIALICTSMLLAPGVRGIYRALLLGVAGLAAVTAEALWGCRPWCVRTVVACAVAAAAPLVAAAVWLTIVAFTESAAAVVLLLLLAFPAAVLYLASRSVVRYVSRRASGLTGGSP